MVTYREIWPWKKKFCEVKLCISNIRSQWFIYIIGGAVPCKSMLLLTWHREIWQDGRKTSISDGAQLSPVLTQWGLQSEVQTQSFPQPPATSPHHCHRLNQFRCSCHTGNLSHNTKVSCLIQQQFPADIPSEHTVLQSSPPLPAATRLSHKPGSWC